MAAEMVTQPAGTRGTSLIIKLPGEPASIETCLGGIRAVVPYCLHAIGALRPDTDRAVCQSFGPNR